MHLLFRVAGVGRGGSRLRISADPDLLHISEIQVGPLLLLLRWLGEHLRAAARGVVLMTVEVKPGLEAVGSRCPW